jgi:glycosyltransferase involved in cell wall biosynthesis
MKLPEKYFLYVGNAYPHKNLERLLKVMSNVKCSAKGGSNVQLVLVGAEDYFYKKLKQKVKEMGLEKNVVFYGEATRGELNNLYKNALALVFPSLMEGFGLPAVEAMANGCLVLASDIPIFHEVLGEAAIYFNPYDVGDIVIKMKTAIIYHTSEYEKCEELRKKGLEQVKQYSWEKLARQTVEVYRSVLK